MLSALALVAALSAPEVAAAEVSAAPGVASEVPQPKGDAAKKPAPPRPERVAALLRQRYPELLARYPSLVHYPSLRALADPLERGESSAILRGLARAFAAATWPEVGQWQRLAYIHAAEPAGYTIWRDGPELLPAGLYQLGCLGSLLEAVRLLWAPNLEFEEIRECVADPAHAAVCDDDSHLGFSVLHHLRRLLPAAAASEVRAHPVTPAGLRELAADPGHLQICAISHRSRRRDDRRYFHHLVILDPQEGGSLRLFDTTGHRGIAYRPLGITALHRYFRDSLARSRLFRYDPASVALHCLAVPRPLPTPVEPDSEDS